MKKFLFSLILAILILFPTKLIFAAVFEVDQSYKPSPAFGSYNISTNAPIAQTFNPTKSKLSSAHVVITSTSVGDFGFSLQLKRGGTTVATSVLPTTLTGSSQTLIFEFSGLPNLSDTIHSLNLETDDVNAKWYYGQADGVGGYTEGNGIVNGVTSAVDFHFVTYGSVEQSDDSGDDEEDQDDEEETTSTKLEAPTNLEALERGSDNINLSWDEVDDENLEGYKIYYGEKRKELDEEVDVGDDNTYQVKGLEAEKFYYFAVTAYDEDREESPKSKILQVKTKTYKEKTDPSDILWYIARILSVLILISAVAIWYWWKKRKAKKGSEKEKKIDVNIQKNKSNIKEDYPKTKMKFED